MLAWNFSGPIFQESVGREFCREEKMPWKMHVLSVKIVEYLKILKINFPTLNLDTLGTLEIPVIGR